MFNWEWTHFDIWNQFLLTVKSNEIFVHYFAIKMLSKYGHWPAKNYDYLRKFGELKCFKQGNSTTKS